MISSLYERVVRLKNDVLATILEAKAAMSKMTVINNIQKCLELVFPLVELSVILIDIFIANRTYVV